MRGIDCPCGHHLQGADDELFRLARERIAAAYALEPVAGS